MSRVSRAIDRVEVIFDDPTLVANAGLILPATSITRLGLESLINSTVRLVGRVGGALPGRKVLTLVATILAGGSHIDHADMLRAGATQRVLGFRVMAPSTLGTFLRSFTFGHVRQLDKVTGKHKQGAGYGYTKRLGYHPILATRADTGEVPGRSDARTRRDTRPRRLTGRLRYRPAAHHPIRRPHHHRRDANPDSQHQIGGSRLSAEDLAQGQGRPCRS